MTKPEIEVRECETLEELAECVQLQRDVFALPEIEISPVRHLVRGRKARRIRLVRSGFSARRAGVLFAYDGGR
jgi:nicotinate-nucleotide pyrophosphorylase